MANKEEDEEEDAPPTLAANVLGSAAAGVIARLGTHPLDTAKARLQAIGAVTSSCSQQKKHPHYYYKGPLDVLGQTWRSEGIRGLYRGFGVVIVGGTPGTVLYLCTYEIAKEKIGRQSSALLPPGSEFLVHFASGMLAEAVACIVYVPVDVIKERMQVQHVSGQGGRAPQQGYFYKSSWDAVKTISQSEGFFTLYRGYGATLLSFGSYSGLFFLFYERLLQHTRAYLANTNPSFAQGQRTVPFHWTVLCSCAAGAAASWLTSPLDMAKLRLQVQRGQSTTISHTGSVTTEASTILTAYRGIVDCLQHSYQNGGMRGLFRGAGARVLHFAPATTVTMTAYESCRSFFAELLP